MERTKQNETVRERRERERERMKWSEVSFCVCVCVTNIISFHYYYYIYVEYADVRLPVQEILKKEKKIRIRTINGHAL